MMIAETGDRVGAESLLAQKPPGASMLPQWAADRANAYGKSIYQRNQRVSKGYGKGKGKKGKDKDKGHRGE